MTIKTWIVFKTKDGEWDAVEADLDNSMQCWHLITDGNRIHGFPSSFRKQDAIDYIAGLKDAVKNLGERLTW
jgi:hypothetical protein